MTISSTSYTPDQYTGTGSTGPFVVTFDVVNEDELKVTKITNATGVETLLVLTTDYTVTIGTSNFITTVAALGTTHDILIERNIALNQELDLPSKGDFSSSDIETALDKLTKQNQDQAESIERSVKISPTVWNSASSVDFVFPSTPGSIPVVNATGDGLDSVTVASVAGINEFVALLTLTPGAIATADTFTAAELHSAGVSTVAGDATFGSISSPGIIGGTTPAAGSFTTITGTSLNSGSTLSIGNSTTGIQYYGSGSAAAINIGSTNAASTLNVGKSAAGAQTYGQSATGIQYYGRQATGEQQYGSSATGDQFYGYQATGKQYYGSSATDNQYYGNAAAGGQYYGRNATGAIEIGSTAGTAATKKLISGIYECTFEQIIRHVLGI